MVIDNQGRLKPHLATSVSRPSPVTYVYRLRRGVRFWDGSELTAQDVANALNYSRYPGTRTAYLFTSVRNIVARDRYTVVVTLKRRDAAWQYAMAQYPAQVFQRQFQNKHGEDYGKPGVLTMGTGPWRVTSLDPTRGAELTANPNYWGGAVAIRRISIRFFANETSMALAMRGGEIDVAPQIEGPQGFGPASRSRLVSVPHCGTGFLSMNVGAAPFRDVRVRRAVALALNRSDLIRAKGGFASPNFTLIPKNQLRLLGSQKAVDRAVIRVPQYQFNLQRARQALAASSTPDGFEVSLDQPVFGDLVKVGEVVAAQLARIGIRVKVNAMPIAAWVAKITGPADQRPFTLTISGCNSPDPSWYASLLLGSRNLKAGSFNTANYAPAAVDTLIADAAKAQDPTRRLDLYRRLLARVGSDVPYVPVWVQNANLAISEGFQWRSYNGEWFNRTWATEIRSR
jgi:peptide/nickel transport system substrate-binding protein